MKAWYPIIRNKTVGLAVLLLGAVPATQAQPVCSITIDPDTTICAGQTVDLHGPAGYGNHLWSTGAGTQNITVGTAGTYWCQVSYPSPQLVTNGNFSAGNTGFTSEFTYNSTLTTDGNYWIGTNAALYHPQFSGTGSGNFMIINSGWPSALFLVWCQDVVVCPGQTYTLSYRARTLSNALPARLQWWIDGSPVGPEVNLPAFGTGWQTINQSWTTGTGQANASICLRAMSGDGIGNDIGLDDISLQGTIVLRDSVNVGVTPLPAFDLGPTTTLCAGQSQTLDASVPGGTYLWQDGSTDPLYNVTAPGNYSVTVTANNCSATDNVQVNYNPVPVVDLGPDQTLCTGQTLLLDVTQPGATYTWQDGSTNGTFHVSGPGTYGVGVLVNGCFSSDAVDIAYNPTPAVDLGNDLVLCAGEQATLDATTPGATYLWSDGSAAPTLTVGANGTYDVDVTVNGCTGTDAVNVTVTPLPVVDLGPDQTVCPGTAITLNATTPGATYLWSDGSTGPTLTTSTPGVHGVLVTVNGCSTSDAMTLANHALPVFSLGPDQTVCAGLAPASFSVNVPGATYLWSTGATGNSIQPTTAGTYWVDVTTNGCTVRDSANVLVTPLPVFSLGNDFSLCPGINATLSAATAGATYLWSTGAVTPTITAGPGSYSVQVTVNGCPATDAINVGAYPAAAVDLGGDVTLCPGDELLLDVSQPGASYLWQDGSVAATYLVQFGSPVSVQLTDANGCVANDAITVTYAPPPSVDLGPDISICQGQQAVLDATVPGATYLWSTGAQTPTIAVATTGTYSVVVTLGTCTANDAVAVSAVPAPTIDLGADQTLCIGDVIVLDATTPGASYQWNTGAQTPTITVTEGGTYSVTLTNAAGCTATDAVTVVEAAPDAIDLGADLTLCQGQSVTLDGTLPGADYDWSTGASTPTILVSASGTYWVVATQGSCSVSDTVEVIVQPAPVADLGNDLTLCAGDDVTLDATNAGATYAWSTGAITPTITVGTAGTYSVTVDLNGCTATDAVDIAVLVPGAIDLGPDVQLCSGDQVVFTVGIAGASYLWSTGAITPTITVVTTSTVWVEVSQGACTSSDTVEVFVLDPGSIDLGNDITVCAGTPVLLDASVPNATYLWNTGAISAQLGVTTSGTYSVTATVAQCTITDQVNVTIVPLPVVDIGGDRSICPGGTATFDASTPGASYLWQDGSTSTTYTTATAGPVNVTVTVNGCSTNDGAEVTVLPAPIVDLGNDTMLCEGASLLLDVTQSGASYAWNDGGTAGSRTVSTEGTYSVTVDLNGCTAMDAIHVDVFAPSSLDLGPDRSLCPGETATLATGIAGQHTWSTGTSAGSILVSQGGTYWVRVQVAACLAQDTVVIAYVPLNEPGLPDALTICQGDTAVLHVDAGLASVLWSTGSTDDPTAVSAAGDYSVTLSLQGCMTSDLVRVYVRERVDSISLGMDSVYCPDRPLVIDVTVPHASYEWSTGATTSSITINSAGTYSLHVTGQCIDAEASIGVTEGECDPFVYVPNTFTPNGDGHNDLFQVSLQGPLRDFSLLLFDRWGELLFSANDPAMAWDGMYNGGAVPDGVYVWKVHYRAPTSHGRVARELIGHVTVLR